MNDECLDISDFIIAYTNNTISEENEVKLIKHLTHCQDCREELAMTLMLSKSILEQSKDVPEDIMKNAFSMILEEDNIQSSNGLENLKYSLKALKDVLSTTKKSVRFVLQFI